ncbi:MAG: NAD(P)H-hydrate dehydratase, partial [Thaumarchaeota archaeon]|nr:NAD(P)H-hydrate dehydratase [Nitrososphaerota archaeon]
TEEAQINFRLLASELGSIEIFEISDTADYGAKKIADKLSGASIIVDAILGTGVKGKLREPMLTAVQLINHSERPVVAVDVPTGLNPSTGDCASDTVRADLTVTFHRLKKGLEKNPTYVGKVEVCEIGVPSESEFFVGRGDFRNAFKNRPAAARKGDFGHVLVVGGSKDYSGAPALCGLAALRTGADLVTVVAPSPIAASLRSYSPNLIVREYHGDSLNEESFSVVDSMLSKIDSVVIGPGLGTHTGTMETVRKLLIVFQENKIPAVVDADALKALTNSLELLRSKDFVLTPHAGEFKIISGLEVPSELLPRIDMCRNFAQKYNCTLVLKGNRCVITDGERIKINRTGNPSMTTGGTGDVLAGVIGCLLSQKNDPVHSGAVGCFINGLAGDAAFEEKGNHILASDLLEKIPIVCQTMTGDR